METGETKWLGLGVVFKDYDTTAFPGWRRGTVGYHTDDRKIFDADYNYLVHPAKITTLTGKIRKFLHCFVLPVLFLCLLNCLCFSHALIRG